ncbi:ABC transporter permease [Microbacterium sp. SLBN-146]|uniref:ABC transporter permease n=1 Tax=Microbacterium sp. SLBN-146 TaxID=2768457 RepID=UPI0011700F63|nr:ABC transporter permease [Microbacterium sp. SLBN-146]TQJ31491.1 ribose transport system permease protein [Microbacterium sp. SLBN-146]
MSVATKTASPVPLRDALTRVRSFGVVLALIVLVVIVTVAQPAFLAPGNLMNILSQWAPIAIMGVGMTYVVITGGFDLSVAAVFALGGVVAAGLGQTMAPMIAFLVAVAVGALAGLLNGFIVTVLRVNPFIATLGSSLILGGVALVVTANRPFVVAFADFGILGSGRFLGVPYSGMVAILVMVVGGLVLAYTAYGQNVYAVGGNLEASHLSGIHTTRVVSLAYVLSGACAGLAGGISASQLSSAQASMGANLLFDVLTVVIVGGTSLAGGKGAVWRTAVGVGILATLQNGFNLLDVDPYYQNIIKGLIIIAALANVRFSRRIRPAA